MKPRLLKTKQKANLVLVKVTFVMCVESNVIQPYTYPVPVTNFIKPTSPFRGVN